MNRKFNWPFFLFVIVLPVLMDALIFTLFYPLVDNPYTNFISSPQITMIGGYILLFSFITAPVVYIGMPYLVVFKNSTITFYRLRRRLCVNLKNIKKVEVHGKLDGHRKGHNISFITHENERIIVFAISHDITEFLWDYISQKGIDISIHEGELGKEVWHKHMKRGY